MALLRHPTVAGEVILTKCYEGNPLVNAFCLGVLRHDQIARGAARGGQIRSFTSGRPPTGWPGGAAFASQDLTKESAGQQRGACSGRSIHGKLVCEACLNCWRPTPWPVFQTWGGGFDLLDLRKRRRGGTGIEIE